ncbi:glycoside hydrolase [Limtongia smithiae]|uniref:glycoside hydrolase n=1 Tax=Limtongia smithiae TaxID=1125753 RepID=UPI0034CDADA4
MSSSETPTIAVDDIGSAPRSAAPTPAPSSPENPFGTPYASSSNIPRLVHDVPDSPGIQNVPDISTASSSSASITTEGGPTAVSVPVIRKTRPTARPLVNSGSVLPSPMPSMPLSPSTSSFAGSRFIIDGNRNSTAVSFGQNRESRRITSSSVSSLSEGRSVAWSTDIRPATHLPPEDYSASRANHSRLKFRSRRIPQGYISEKPWLKDRQKGDRILMWITVVTCVIGCGIVGVLVWAGISSVTNYKYCVVMQDDFSSGTIDETLWTREVELGGFGNGEFEWTTDNDNNTFIQDGQLYIVPTLTSDVIGEDYLLNGYTVNLTSDGTCTSSTLSDCAIRSNSSEDVMIPPIQSGRISSKASIKYGLVEVRARLPAGDWIWPAIWMLPTDNVYGSWPASGEIDIMESRGNDHTYPDGGNNFIVSTLHWGVSSATDMYYKIHNSYKLRRDTYKKFHTYALEWSDKYLTIYVDGRLRQVIYHTFSESFWELGDFSTTFDNGSSIQDPWPANNNRAPFDQEFYLILNVAVGGTNGFFADDVGDKPWTDGDRQIAMHSFWTNRETWESTWGDTESRALVIDSVSMYKICD